MTHQLICFVLIASLMCIVHGYSNRLVREAEKTGCLTDLCWKDPSYPREKIEERLLNTDKNVVHILGSINKYNTDQQTFDDPPRGYCRLCSSMMNRLVKPLSIIEEDRKFYILNTEKYEQSIVINICNNDEHQTNSRCFKKNENNLPYGIKSACEQKYTQMKVLCYDPSTNEFVGKTFSYPSSCVCVIKHHNYL